LLPGVEVPIDPPSSILAGESFLARIYDAMKGARSSVGSNAFNTTLFIGWDEPGGTYDHVPPGPVRPPDPSAPLGELGFRFDRSGYRVPAIIVSSWVGSGVVFNDEYRHTSMIATLREVWNLGKPFTARDADARTFHHVLDLEVPRDPDLWPEVAPRPVPTFQIQQVSDGRALCRLGKQLCHGLLHHEKQFATTGLQVPFDPDAEISPELALDIVNRIAARIFPQLGRHQATEGRID
jgi:phospholipase C